MIVSFKFHPHTFSLIFHILRILPTKTDGTFMATHYHDVYRTQLQKINVEDASKRREPTFFIALAGDRD